MFGPVIGWMSLVWQNTVECALSSHLTFSTTGWRPFNGWRCSVGALPNAAALPPQQSFARIYGCHRVCAQDLQALDTCAQLLEDPHENFVLVFTRLLNPGPTPPFRNAPDFTGRLAEEMTMSMSQLSGHMEIVTIFYYNH